MRQTRCSAVRTLVCLLVLLSASSALAAGPGLTMAPPSVSTASGAAPTAALPAGSVMRRFGFPDQTVYASE